MPPPEPETPITAPKRVGPPPLPRLTPPPPKPTADLPRPAPTLDFSGLKDEGDSPDSVRRGDRSQSGVGSTAGSSLSTQTHVDIDRRLQQEAKIALANIHEIDLPVLRDLSAMLLYGRWITDEQKLRLAITAFLARAKKEKEATFLRKETKTLEAMFLRELGKSHMDLAKKLSADKERRKTPPASNG